MTENQIVEMQDKSGTARYIIRERNKKVFFISISIQIAFIVYVFVASGFQYQALVFFGGIFLWLYFCLTRYYAAKIVVCLSPDCVSIGNSFGYFAKRPTIIPMPETVKFELNKKLFMGSYSMKSLFHNHFFMLSQFTDAVLLIDHHGKSYCVCDYLRYSDRKALCDRLNEKLTEIKSANLIDKSAENQLF